MDAVGFTSASALYGRGVERGYPFYVSRTPAIGSGRLSIRAREDQLRANRSALIDLRRSIDKVMDELGVRRVRPTIDGNVVDFTRAVSNALSFAAASPSTLGSTEEVNTATTSYDTHTPDFEGGSTVSIVVDDTYDGSAGSGELRFEVEATGRGGRDRKVVVYGADGKTRDSFTFQDGQSTARTVTLKNRLQITFGEGVFEVGDVARLQVSDVVGTDVDPTKPFNGIGDDDPDLDDTQSVSDGTFDLNGVTIEVFATDSINSLLARINSAGAGVTATYDAATDTVQFAATEDGPAGEVDLRSDTSGVLKALKLNTAQVTPGTDAEQSSTIGSVPQFGSVTNGTITVNGETVSVDVNHDTFTDVIDRINATTSVTAAFDGARVTIASVSANTTLTIDDTSGFLTAIGIESGTYDPDLVEGHEASPGLTRARAERVATALAELAEQLNVLFGPQTGGKANSSLARMRAALQTEVTAAYEATGSQVSSRFGPDFDFDNIDGDVDVVRFRVADQRRVADHLVQGRLGDVQALLLGEGRDDEGLLGRLARIVDEEIPIVEARLGDVGRVFDLSA